MEGRVRQEEPDLGRRDRSLLRYGGICPLLPGNRSRTDDLRELGLRTPEEAGNWVEYCNGTGDSYYAALRRSHGYEKPFNVKYWCIGNECYAEPDIGTQNDVAVYIRDAREFIKFMKLTDKSIKTVLVGSDDPAWNKAVLDALSPMTDYLSLHHYSAENGKGIYGPFEGGKAACRHAGGSLRAA